VRVRPARSSKDVRRFIDLPFRLHARDPLWVPPLRRDVATLLSRTKNPFFEHAEAEYFLAERDGEIVGRIAAIHNRLHNETHADRVGFFGFFECRDDQAVADALFAAAADWLRPRGLDTLRGPASFSVNDECGLLVEGFETPPTLMMPHNPRYYTTLVDRAGFAKAKDLLCFKGDDPADEFGERLVRATDLIRRRFGITVRPLDMGRFTEEVALIKRLYNQGWEKNWGFVPMTDHEIDHLAEQFKPVVVPELVLFAEKEGRVVGFAICLPDLNVAFRPNRSGAFLPGLVRVLWMLKTRRIGRMRVLLLGILPEFRGKGVDAILYDAIWHNGNANGIHWGEAGWILEDNAAMIAGMVKIGWKHYKTYRLYDRPI
jgi:GNAT superfamily N-acetyltransferase